MTTDTHIAECVRDIHHMKMRQGQQPVTLAWPAHGGGPKPTRKPPAVRTFVHQGIPHSAYTAAFERADRGVSEDDTVERALALSRVAEAALAMLTRSVLRYRTIPRWRRDIRVPRRQKP